MCVLSSCSPSYINKGDVATLKTLNSIQRSNTALQLQKTKSLQYRYNKMTHDEINKMTRDEINEYNNKINYIFYSLFSVIVLILLMYIFRKKIKIIVFGKEKAL